MRSIISLVLITLTLLTSIPRLGMAQVSKNGLWTDTTDLHSDAFIETPVAQGRFRLFSLDTYALEAVLALVPQEDDLVSPVTISIPMPNGGFDRFEIVESSIMEAALAAKFPELRTYSGIGVDDSSASLRLSVTPLGLHGQILSANGSIYIDPDRNANSNQYISYRKRDYQPHDREPWRCLVDDTHRQNVASRSPVDDAQVSRPTRHGEIQRRYRLALATTGEYTNFHGGTVAAGLTAVVVTMNRVNGIYERDVGVRMVLVADNDQIIYTNASRDPYSNNNPDALIDQNRRNLNRVIGASNYDIGHVFSTGGGGLAELGVPCGNLKAAGVTGRSEPIGDPFDVDYVAHEMGHQFGAEHTFNGSRSNCSGGNRNASTAFEPGSGTTIMGYAGICGADNIQPNSDDYFHGVSLQNIVNFIIGAGNSCAETDQTDNVSPVADAGTGFTIPVNTPFELTGSGTDANGDSLTFNWEQMDSGPAGAPNNPSGNAPIFRSFPFSENPTRTFPQLSDLLAGTQTIGELLPGYSRTLNFGLTVRDNHPGGSGFDQDAVQIVVNASAGPFRVTAPNSAVTWDGNSTEVVTWDVANTNNTPINCASVDILFSSDGGNTFSTTVINATPNDGSKSITVPNIETSSARLKVKCSDNVFFDVTDASFTVLPNSPDAADLVVSVFDVTTSSVMPGGALEYDLAILNQGSLGTVATHARLVLSSDAVIDGSDLRLTRPSLRVPALAAGASAPLSGEVTIPLDVLPGTYYLGAIVDPSERVAESDETNNTRAVTVAVTAVPDEPDLVVSTLDVVGSPMLPGESLSYDMAILNQGSLGTVATHARLVLSSDAVTDGSDLRLTRPSLRVPALAAGASAPFSGEVTIPLDVLPGTYYLGAIVDPSERVAESDETNNTRAMTITLVDATMVYHVDYESGSTAASVGSNNEELKSGGTISAVVNPYPDRYNSSSMVGEHSIPGNSTVTSRAELTSQREPTDGEVFWYKWSYYIPSDYFTTGWNIFSQWKTWPCSKGRDYATEICYTGGIFDEVTANSNNFNFKFRANPDCYTYKPSMVTDQWVNWKMKIYWTNNPDGYVKVYRNGSLAYEMSRYQDTF